MLGGFGLRLGAQVIYFIVVARTLGAAPFGVFAGSAALVTVLAPFAAWGSGNILIKHVARNPQAFPTYWGAALATSSVCGVACCALAVLLGALGLSPETAWRVILPIAVGDLIGIRAADLSAQAFQARERLAGTASLWFVMSLCRLLAATGFLILALPKTAQNWSLVYMASGLLAGGTGLVAVRQNLGWGPCSLRPMRGEWREGFYFATGLAAQGAYNDIDKTLLLRLASAAEAGAYAAAYRVLDGAFIPVRSLLYASYARFFQEGTGGVRQAARFARVLLGWAAVYGIAVGLALVGLREVLPTLLGAGYQSTAPILAWLSPLPLFRAFHYMAADALTGSGFQGIRTAAQVAVAALNLLLNLWLIPTNGWRGAAWTSLLSDALLAIGLWTLLMLLVQREPRADAPIAR